MPIDDELVCACALSRIFAYNCLASRQLVESVDSIQEIFKMTWKSLAQVFPKHTGYADAITDPSNLEWARRELDFIRESGAEAIFIYDGDYPKRLVNCPDAPIVLYYKGTADLNASRILAVVGTRSATVYGRNVCREIISTLSENPVKPLIVSGLAYGIDIVAHQSALECGLETVGCMATGLDRIYPSQNEGVATRMIGKGGLLTDFTSGTEPYRENFVRRNRIIAGMADAVLVVESKDGGGSMITARLATDYDRELFAVPGRTTDICSRGTNALIENDRAHLTVGAETIEKWMGWRDPSREESRGKRKETLSMCDTPEKRKILNALRKDSPLSVDDMKIATGLTFQEMSVALLQLEMEGRICITAANYYDLS
ncbi:MAG: DNA-processing protein DprA [Bacteroidales bacterium]|jgi:DNA processing protein|nr:DNA-processing protein DprA [Bacteroidales bacterium]MCI2121294.1 DNA-processing protein DprA [Bacteroidales bacterium]MCI2145216.1 DNA-processing protein DprA [Bacteroidales bacterium]